MLDKQNELNSKPSAIFSHKGFSLVEIMVAIGIVSIIGYVVITLLNSSLMASKHVQLNTDRTNLENSILLVLSDNKLCSAGLQNAAGNVLSYDGTKVSVNQIAANGMIYAKVNNTDLGIRVESMELVPVQDLGPFLYTKWDTTTAPPTPAVLNYHKYLVQLNVAINKVDANPNQPTFFGGGKKIVAFNLTVLTDSSKKIADCFAEDSAAKACDDLGGIFDSSKNPRCLIQYLGVGYRNAGLASDPQLMNYADPTLLVRGRYNAATGSDNTLYLLADGKDVSKTAGLAFGVLNAGGASMGGGSLGSGSFDGAFGSDVRAGDFALSSGVGKDIHLVSRIAVNKEPTRLLIKNNGLLLTGDISAGLTSIANFGAIAGTMTIGFANKNAVAIGQNTIFETGVGVTRDGKPAGSFYVAPTSGAVMRSYQGNDSLFIVEPPTTPYTGNVAMTIKADSSNIGIGDDAPIKRLTVRGTSTADGSLDYSMAIVATGAEKSTTAGISFVTPGPNGGYGGIGVGSLPGNFEAPTAGSLGLTATKDLFLTAGAGGINGFLMVMGSNGYTGVGTSAPTERLHVNGNIRIEGDALVTGTATSNSDERLKKDFSFIPNALERVLNIHGYTFHWIDEAKSKDRQIGLRAQEVEKVFPELVKKDKQGIRSVAYQNLVAPIIEALRQLYLLFTQQDVRISALEEENAQIRAENAEIKESLCALTPKAKFCATERKAENQ